MSDVRRWKRIVAVRTAQRNVSAMRLREAKQDTLQAAQRLAQAQTLLTEASLPLGGVTRLDLERMDLQRCAAWEEIAEWQSRREAAEQAQAQAQAQVEARHLQLRQSERLEEAAERSEQRRASTAEQRFSDEQARRRR